MHFSKYWRSKDVHLLLRYLWRYSVFSFSPIYIYIYISFSNVFQTRRQHWAFDNPQHFNTYEMHCAWRKIGCRRNYLEDWLEIWDITAGFFTHTKINYISICSLAIPITRHPILQISKLTLSASLSYSREGSLFCFSVLRWKKITSIFKQSVIVDSVTFRLRRAHIVEHLVIKFYTLRHIFSGRSARV